MWNAKCRLLSCENSIWWRFRCFFCWFFFFLVFFLGFFPLFYFTLNEAWRANLNANKRILKWQAFWSKVYSVIWPCNHFTNNSSSYSANSSRRPGEYIIFRSLRSFTILCDKVPSACPICDDLGYGTVRKCLHLTAKFCTQAGAVWAQLDFQETLKFKWELKMRHTTHSKQ